MKPDKCPACGRSTKQRSSAQNRSMFGIAYRLIAERLTELWGEEVTTAQVHEIMKDKFSQIFYDNCIDDRRIVTVANIFGDRWDKVAMPNSTKRLTTVGMMKYYEAMQKWAAIFLQVDIPSPNEIPFEQISTEE